MLNLLDRSWKSFRISDLFEISGTITTHPSKLIPDGKTPRVTCAAVNNGLDTTYQNEPTEKGDVLTIDSATIGFVSYQLRDFIATDHVEKLTRKDGKPLGYYTGLFIKVCIDNSVNGKYGYGYKFSQTRIKKQYILVPIGKDDLPDWAFMEAYMRQLEQDILKPTIAKMKERIIDAPKPEGGGKWKQYNFVDVFVIMKGFYNKKPPCYKNGTYPFIGATDSNNGITGYTTYKSIEENSKTGDGKNEPIERKIYPKGAMCVTNNGSVGYAYYQEHKFTCTHDVNPLYLKGREINRYLATYIIRCIEQQRVCFEYARKWRPKRMVKSKILLPSKENGSPDWQYMEDYMKYVEQRQLRQAVEAMSARVS